MNKNAVLFHALFAFNSVDTLDNSEPAYHFGGRNGAYVDWRNAVDRQHDNKYEDLNRRHPDGEVRPTQHALSISRG